MTLAAHRGHVPETAPCRQRSVRPVRTALVALAIALAACRTGEDTPMPPPRDDPGGTTQASDGVATAAAPATTAVSGQTPTATVTRTPLRRPAPHPQRRRRPWQRQLQPRHPHPRLLRQRRRLPHPQRRPRPCRPRQWRGPSDPWPWCRPSADASSGARLSRCLPRLGRGFESVFVADRSGIVRIYNRTAGKISGCSCSTSPGGSVRVAKRGCSRWRSIRTTLRVGTSGSGTPRWAPRGACVCPVYGRREHRPGAHRTRPARS